MKKKYNPDMQEKGYSCSKEVLSWFTLRSFGLWQISNPFQRQIQKALQCKMCLFSVLIPIPLQGKKKGNNWFLQGSCTCLQLQWGGLSQYLSQRSTPCVHYCLEAAFDAYSYRKCCSWTKLCCFYPWLNLCFKGCGFPLLPKYFL